MIQRIQTLYLLTTFILTVLWYFTPLAELANNQEQLKYTIYGLKDPNGNYVFKTLVSSIIAAITSFVTVATIFLYKNRMKQIRAAQFLLLLNTALIASAFLLIDKAKAALALTNEVIINYSLSMTFPLISLVLIFMSIKAIKKDEELVRSADRLR